MRSGVQLGGFEISVKSSSCSDAACTKLVRISEQASWPTSHSMYVDAATVVGTAAGCLKGGLARIKRCKPVSIGQADRRAHARKLLHQRDATPERHNVHCRVARFVLL